MWSQENRLQQIQQSPSKCKHVSKGHLCYKSFSKASLELRQLFFCCVDRILDEGIKVEGHSRRVRVALNDN